MPLIEELRSRCCVHEHGGIVEITAAMPEATPHWGVYFTVEDCDRAVEQASELNGRPCRPVMEVAGVGRFAILEHPQGAEFSVIQLESNSASDARLRSGR